MRYNVFFFPLASDCSSKLVIGSEILHNVLLTRVEHFNQAVMLHLTVVFTSFESVLVEGVVAAGS